MLTGKRLRQYLAYAVHDQKTEPTPARKPPAKAKRATPKQRRGPDRDEDYRAFVREHPCCACASETRVEAAHTNVLREQSAKGGMSLKSSDYSVVPLCHDCHQARPDSYHRIAGGERGFERAWRVKLAGVVARLRAEWKRAA
jgi:hypothetical protein